MSKPIKMVRVYITETKRDHGENLYKELFRLLHDTHQIHGMTVFRGIAGFDSKGEVHSSDLLRLSVDLPLVIEFFDDPKVVDAALKMLAEHVPECRIISWDAICS